MPITFIICRDDGYIISKYEGKLSDEDLLDAYKVFYQGDDWRPGLNELVDLSQAEVSEITTDCVRRLALYVESVFRAQGISSAKTAVYAPKDLPFGLSSVYSAYASESPENVRVFRDLFEAKEWLKE